MTPKIKKTKKLKHQAVQEVGGWANNNKGTIPYRCYVLTAWNAVAMPIKQSRKSSQ